MRCFFARTLLITLIASPLSALEIKDVSHTYWPAKNFTRISEFLNGKENHGRRVIFRTAEERSGYYFVISLDQSIRDLPAGTKIKVDAYPEGIPDYTTFEYDLPTPKDGGREIFIGLTGGENWPAKTQSNAWRITLTDSTGNALAEKTSFLWQE